MSLHMRGYIQTIVLLTICQLNRAFQEIETARCKPPWVILEQDFWSDGNVKKIPLRESRGAIWLSKSFSKAMRAKTRFNRFRNGQAAAPCTFAFMINFDLLRQIVVGGQHAQSHLKARKFGFRWAPDGHHEYKLNKISHLRINVRVRHPHALR